MESEKERKEQRRQRKSSIRGRERMGTPYDHGMRGLRKTYMISEMKFCTEIKLH